MLRRSPTPRSLACIDWYGEPKVVAMVLLLAYSNFQDRLLLALGVPIEAVGPMPPPEIELRSQSRPAAGTRPASRRRDDPFRMSLSESTTRSGSRCSSATSRSGSRNSGRRSSRIRIPTWDEVLRVLPPDLPRPEKPVRIQWNLVTQGYQPELALAWSACTRASGRKPSKTGCLKKACSGS